MGPSSGLVIRVVVGILLLGYAAVRFAEKGVTVGPILCGVVGLFFVARGLTTSGRR